MDAGLGASCDVYKTVDVVSFLALLWSESRVPSIRNVIVSQEVMGSPFA
jgi:hypothetical protein